MSGLDRILRLDITPNRVIVGPNPEFGTVRHITMALIYPYYLIGRTYLSEPDDYEDIERPRIVESIDKHRSMLEDNPDFIKFKCNTYDGILEEIRSYNKLHDKVEAHDDEEGDNRFKIIYSHQGPLKPGDMDYK